MNGPFVVLTGASGSGKTAIAMAIEKRHPELAVFRFDTIGVPSAEVMATYGTGHQPGGAWQRAMTLQWFRRIAPIVRNGSTVLFEGQMRLAFIKEALAAENITAARVVLVDCDDNTRTARLTHFRQQANLANESMMGWATYLRAEAKELGAEVLDTTELSLEEGVTRIEAFLRPAGSESLRQL